MNLDSEFPIGMLTLNFQDVFAYIKHKGYPVGSIIAIKKKGKKITYEHTTNLLGREPISERTEGIKAA